MTKGRIKKFSMGLLTLISMGSIETVSAMGTLGLGKREQCPALNAAEINNEINEILSSHPDENKFATEVQAKVQEQFMKMGETSKAIFKDSSNLINQLSIKTSSPEKKRGWFRKKQKEVMTAPEGNIKEIQDTFKPTRFSRETFSNFYKVDVPYKEKKTCVSVDYCQYDIVTNDNKKIPLITYIFNYRDKN